MQQRNQSKTNFMSTAAIMSIFLISMGVCTITPAIQNIAQAYPDVPYTTIIYASTLPTLFLLPASLITGAVAGKTVKYKTIALIGVLLFVISGVAPVFINSTFTLVLISRAIFGIALGMISPLGNAIIFGLYDGQKRANLIGLGTVVMNLGGVILQMLGGTLAGINWNYSFLGHGLGIVSFLIVLFFLPEPNKIEEPAENIKSGKKEKLGAGVWIICLLFGVVNILNNPTMMNTSTLLVNRGLGDSTVAATVLSLFTIGGMIGGAIFGKVFQITKRFVISVACGVMAIGVGLLVIAKSTFVMMAGMTFLGLGFSLCMPAIFMILGMMTTPSQNAFAISLATAILNLGGFVSTYWVMAIQNITGDGVFIPIVIEFVVFLAAAVVFIIVNPMPKPKEVKEAK